MQKSVKPFFYLRYYYYIYKVIINQSLLRSFFEIVASIKSKIKIMENYLDALIAELEANQINYTIAEDYNVYPMIDIENTIRVELSPRWYTIFDLNEPAYSDSTVEESGPAVSAELNYGSYEEFRYHIFANYKSCKEPHLPFNGYPNISYN